MPAAITLDSTHTGYSGHTTKPLSFTPYGDAMHTSTPPAAAPAAARVPADVAEQRAGLCSKGAWQAGAAGWRSPVVAEAAWRAEQAGGAEGGGGILARGTHLQNCRGWG